MEHEILVEQLLAYLACAHELKEYGLYLQSFPCRAAVLASPHADEMVIGETLAAAKEEWSMILDIESWSAQAKKTLHLNCPHVRFFNYRELMSCMEKNKYEAKPEVRQVAEAWFPPFGQSANLEHVFREMEQAAKRCSGFKDSLSSLMTVAVRGLKRRILDSQDTPRTVELTEEDWHGHSVRALKHKIWSPSSAAPSVTSEKNIHIYM